MAGAMPFYGVQTIVFVSKLAICEIRDDFQLFNFIQNLKGMELFSGIILVIFNALGVIRCALSDDPEQQLRTVGPGVSTGACIVGDAFCTWVQGVEVLLKILLCWVAFWLTQFSVPFAGKVHIDSSILSCTIDVWQHGRRLQDSIKAQRRRSSRVNEGLDVTFTDKTHTDVVVNPSDSSSSSSTKKTRSSSAILDARAYGSKAKIN